MKLTSNQINKIKDIIISLLRVNLANLEFQKSVSDNQEHRKTFTRLINHTNKSIELVRNIKHIDILCSIFNTFVVGKEPFYITLSENIYKNVKIWDTTSKGYSRFKELEKQGKEEYEKELKEKQEKAQAIEKARQEGKKIEWVMNEKGKLEQVVVDNKTN